MVKHPKFGDVVTNVHVTNTSPWHRMTFVEVIRRRGRLNHGIWYRCTDGKGRFAEFQPDAIKLIEVA